MSHFWLKPIFLFLCYAMLCTEGCTGNNPAVDGNARGVVHLDDAITNAGKSHQPLVILIGEFDGKPSLLDEQAIQNRAGNIGLLSIDLTISRNRATAARYHTATLPVLVCLSPRGVIVTRDQLPITKELILQRLDDLPARASDLDKQLTAIKALNPDEFKDTMVIQQQMSEFLLSHHNDLEAIPYLADLAKSETISSATRINAWVSMARAHLWIAEPEKARHEAKGLIATLGPKHPEAIAGGNLVLGLQDATAKRAALARQEFETAISVAHNSKSEYAEQARIELDHMAIVPSR